MIKIEKKNDMIGKMSVEIKKFIKEYAVLLQYYETF